MDIVINETDSFEFIKKYKIKNNLMKIETNNDTKESFLTLIYEEMDDALNTKKYVEKSEVVKNINLTYA